MSKSEKEAINVKDIDSEHVQKPKSYFKGIARGVSIDKESRAYSFYLQDTEEILMAYVTDDGRRKDSFDLPFFRELESTLKASSELGLPVIVCGEVQHMFPDTHPDAKKMLIKARSVVFGKTNSEQEE